MSVGSTGSESQCEAGRCPIVTEMVWDAMSSDGGTVKDPSWERIEERIRGLNTPENSIVILAAANGKQLTVAGDQHHGFLVYLSCQEDHRYVVADTQNIKGKVTMVIGFQPGEYASRILVNLETVLRVASTFFRTGDGDETVHWTRDIKAES
jgi:hypothetical protein